MNILNVLFGSKLKLANAGMYVLAGLVIWYAVSSWQSSLEDRAVLRKEKAELTIMNSDLEIQLQIERAVIDRLLVSEKIIGQREKVATDLIEESKDEEGNIDTSAISLLLCKRGLATDEACNRANPQSSVDGN